MRAVAQRSRVASQNKTKVGLKVIRSYTTCYVIILCQNKTKVGLKDNTDITTNIN